MQLLSLENTEGKICFEKSLSKLSLALLEKYNCTIVFASYSIMADIVTKLSFSYKTVFKQKEKNASISKIVNNKSIALSINFCSSMEGAFHTRTCPL